MINCQKTKTLIFLLLFAFHFAFATDIPFLEKESIPVPSQSTVTSWFEYLAQEDIQTLTLRTDLNALMKSKVHEEPDYQAAILVFRDQNGDRQSWDIKVRVRGKRRRTYCVFPPIKIKMPKKKLEEMGFARDFNDLKIVTHCDSHVKNEDYLMREYLCYRMYNQLTDHSFRVKLLRINYEDTEGKHKPESEYAFIIENTDEMAHRLNGEEFEEESFKLKYLKNEITALQDVFQYMIGNTDYKIDAYHNVKLVKKNKASMIFPVPYDFDYSGLVNTTYSAPAEGLKAKSVRERFFLGYCAPELVWEKVFQTIVDQRTAIFELIDQMEPLNPKSKKFIKKYLEDFYLIIQKESLRQRRILNQCIK